MKRTFKNTCLKPNFSRHSGFTLIELLTVIAIIGILASILIPVVGKVRESARINRCLAQLRDLGLACHLYAEDFGDRIPANFNPSTGKAATEWGSYAPDRGPGLLLAREKGGATQDGWEGDYLDEPSQLFCPYSKDELFSNPGYNRPETIPHDNPLVRIGYMWIFYEAGSSRDNSKTTVDNPNRPYLFDFPLPGTAALGEGFTVNPHENRVNVWHIGGHVTSVDSEELQEKAGSREQLYDFLTFKVWGKTQ